MKIYIDADAVPNALRDILFRAAGKNSIHTILVANQPLKIPRSEFLSGIEVKAGPDEADDTIVELIEAGDIVITADIPLSDCVISRGGFVINHRGELLTSENIKERLSMRNLMDELRSIGIETGGPSALSQKDRQQFANQLDRFLTKYHRKKG